MKAFRVALVVQKSIPGAFEENLLASMKIIALAASNGAKVIVFPEMNLTGYTAGLKTLSIAQPMNHKLLGSLSSAANKFEISILAGMAEQGENNQVFASHLVFSPGKPADQYRKIHTAPNEKKYFSPGNKVKIFQHKQVHFGIQLCYDAHFPELSTAMAVQGADIIFIPHASPRGTPKEKYRSWMRHLTARAFDNGVFIAAVNQTGDNAQGLTFPGLALLIGPDGNIVSKYLNPEETIQEETIHYADIDLNELTRVRSHRMRYFLPNRRTDLFGC